MTCSCADYISYMNRWQAERHCDKADKVFSEVVDCCGEGLSSVERLLTGTKTIVDDDGKEAISLVRIDGGREQGGRRPTHLLIASVIELLPRAPPWTEHCSYS